MTKTSVSGDTNRTAARKPFRTKIWCSGCDGNKVAPGSRCKVCGGREPTIRHRKQEPCWET